MATVCEQVMIGGKVRGFAVVANWVRVDGGWDVTVVLGEKTKTHRINNAKPCWTCSLPLLEQLLPKREYKTAAMKPLPKGAVVKFRREA